MIRKQIILSTFVLLLGTFISPYYAKAILSDHEVVLTTSSEMNEDNQLYREIKAYSDQHYIEPIDAKVDRIWKAIPGYNGLSVDINASYKKMKTSGEFNKNDIVFKEISPNVHLEDLGPQPIYRGNPEKPMIAFLINVAWGNEYIPGMLDVLKKHQTKATFFFDGSWVKKNPDLAKLIKEAGHEIGNHAYSHPNLQQRSEGETMMELKKTNDVIKETLGITPVWFAPPSGSFNQITIQVANRLHMKTILWTVDTVDWKKPAASEMVRRVVSKVENGSMVLMHPTKPTAEGLESMITEIKSKGYKLSTVSELMSEKRVD
ncbi:polysaccharide deacetylase family protein [Bacillus sp. DTU_2020_1000418_1_SI_GHA_SEK_038]|uniref:polysaccharide deacetylase family protein n=1 Tax=Bacillus sp. DTU_2020_1000418_1_SI_GHA_SEK_038 TaxID=3077585 RepID=UPI0028EE2147|nr:polysaccharide deacetylase family protein [Bacillus sp. DTU_2020_1000418_1_SI_GHA_SEK_038]WNS75643.1 polysaccharide deacetylase family protein [Bacillus sp. DTU_2020_1000418_1_SI_GHA_SEK_038]